MINYNKSYFLKTDLGYLAKIAQLEPLFEVPPAVK